LLLWQANKEKKKRLKMDVWQKLRIIIHRGLGEAIYSFSSKATVKNGGREPLMRVITAALILNCAIYR
jgi:hypothetical protein